MVGERLVHGRSQTALDQVTEPGPARLRPISSVIVIIGVIFCAIGFCLETGVWTRTESVRGPFQAEGSGASVYLVHVGLKGRRGWIVNAIDDDVGTSDLKLWVNGEEWGPPHAAHTLIRGGDTHAFSHWDGNVHLWLPAELANDAAEVRVQYSLRLPPVLLRNLVTATVGLIFLHLALFGGRREEVRAPWLRYVTAGFLLVFPVLSWLVIIGILCYAGTIVYGIYAGYALPTAAAFDLVPQLRRMATVEPYAPIAILIFAALGPTMSWLAHLRLLPKVVVRHAEIAQIRLWRSWGLLVLLGAMIFSVSSAGWNGQVRSTDWDYSLAALVPNSDAANYLTAVSDQIQLGSWTGLGSRRPLAEAFRQITAFTARYSYTGILLVQTAIIALMLFLAASRVAAWRGIWAALAFVGLIYLVARPFLITLMTEPLGIIWALFSWMFFVEALRRRSFSHALVALLALTFGLWTRMGAMFALPLLMLSAVLGFASHRIERLRLLLATVCVVLAVISVNAALAFLYGETGVVTGGNFAYTLCGLSLGGNWADCASNYASGLEKLDEKSQAIFLVTKAWENFTQDPHIAVGTVLQNARAFVLGWPEFFLGGTTQWSRSMLMWLPLVLLALLPGLIHVLRSRASWGERSFWLLLWVGVIASAAIVFEDGGWRALSVSNVLLAAFLALAFVAPGNVVARARDHWSVRPKQGILTIAIAAALFIVTPALARMLDRIELPTDIGPPQINSRLVAGGRWPTGFLVLADGASRLISPPSMSYSEFARMVRVQNLEAELGPFLDQAAARLPFAFMTAPDIDQRNSTAIYIAPPEVLSRREVKVWRLSVPQMRPNHILRLVERAEPVSLR